MKNLIITISCCLILGSAAYGCDCEGGSLAFIKEKYSKTELIIKAKIMGFKQIPTIENNKNHADTLYWTEQADIEVLDIINGKLISTNKRLALLGCNGFNCYECLKFYKVGDEVVLMLSGHLGSENYFVSNCGTYHARYADGKISGLLNFSIEKYLSKRNDLEKVKDSLTQDYYTSSGNRSDILALLKKIKNELHHYYNDDYRITQSETMSYRKYKRLIKQRLTDE